MKTLLLGDFLKQISPSLSLTLIAFGSASVILLFANSFLLPIVAYQLYFLLFHAAVWCSVLLFVVCTLNNSHQIFQVLFTSSACFYLLKSMQILSLAKDFLLKDLYLPNDFLFHQAEIRVQIVGKVKQRSKSTTITAQSNETLLTPSFRSCNIPSLAAVFFFFLSILLSDMHQGMEMMILKCMVADLLLPHLLFFFRSMACCYFCTFSLQLLNHANQLDKQLQSEVSIPQLFETVLNWLNERPKTHTIPTKTCPNTCTASTRSKIREKQLLFLSLALIENQGLGLQLSAF